MFWRTASLGRASKNSRTCPVHTAVRMSADIWFVSDWPTIPQLYVNGEFVGGCDILLNSMCTLCSSCLRRETYSLTPVHQSGELDELLVKSGVIPPEEAEAEAEADSQSKN